MYWTPKTARLWAQLLAALINSQAIIELGLCRTKYGLFPFEQKSRNPPETDHFSGKFLDFFWFVFSYAF